MATYEVYYTATTGFTVTVEADDEAAARLAADAEVEDMSVDRLPELWPHDFAIEEVERYEDAS